MRELESLRTWRSRSLPFYNNDDSRCTLVVLLLYQHPQVDFHGRLCLRFSALGVTIHSTSDLSPIQELDIPGHVLPDWYYYEEDDVEESESEGSDDGAVESESN